MGDRRPERPGLGPLDVDVDPLVVAGGVGELVDLVLGDLDAVAVAEVLADERAQFVGAVDRACSHVRQHVKPVPPATNAAYGRPADHLRPAPTGQARRRRRPPRRRTSARVTFAELERVTNQLAHVLRGHGVGPGVKVVWCGQNSMGVANLVVAARKVGATAVPLNYRLSDEEAAYVTDHSDATRRLRRRRAGADVRAHPRRDPQGHRRARLRRRRAGRDDRRRRARRGGADGAAPELAETEPPRPGRR